MQRRVALKSMAAAVGLISLPAWANGWSKASVASIQPSLSASQDALLAEIVETIIPATDTPGAKELGVHSFIQKMVTDCYEPKVQANLVKGLDTVEAMARKSFGKSFAAGDNSQRLGVLKELEQATDAGQKEFLSLVKGLTIRGYLTSEYVMTNLTHYEMIPGHYYGCVPVSSKTSSK